MLDPSRAIAKLLSEDRRYKFDAYVFVFEALNFAQDELHMGTETSTEGVEEGDPDAVERHVTGQELCEAIRRFALKQYGYMAKTVLNSWGIHGTGDFGEIVFNLIRIGQMKKTKHDDRKDFDDVYDFETALHEEFKIMLPD